MSDPNPSGPAQPPAPFAGEAAVPVRPFAMQSPWHWNMPRRRSAGPLIAMFICFTLSFLLAVGIALATAGRMGYFSFVLTLIEGLLTVVLTPGFCIAYFVLVLVWVWNVHRDLRVLTEGRYRPTPGMAMGLLFVPLFQWFWLAWLLFAMSRLAREAPQFADEPRRTGPCVGVVSLAVYSVAMLLTVAGAILLASLYASVGPYMGEEALRVLGTALLCSLLVANTALVHAFVVISRDIGRYVQSAVAFLPPDPLMAPPPRSLPVPTSHRPEPRS